MATLSQDGQSFSIDGRRVWLVSGSIHYPRVPHELWRDRIRAAKQAGLNCICTHVFWNFHEPTPKNFYFKANADLRHFVELIGNEGMYCILRPGPFVGAEWDGGGLPAWLGRDQAVRLRDGNGAFMEVCARYLGQVLDQIADLQVTSQVMGPIVLMQAENQWMCHSPLVAERYLREIVRYMRENGCTVPITVANNLWQRVDGAMDTWNAREDLAADLRQLRVVQPDAPRLVSEYWPGEIDCWGHAHNEGLDAPTTAQRLAQILSVGAQFNLYMFHGGTNFGFFAGRGCGQGERFVTTSHDYSAPLAEGGMRGEKYFAVKRISMFASQFGHVFAHLDPDLQHVVVHSGDEKHGLSVIHQSGAQGDVVFIIKSPDDKTKQTRLLLSNGLSLEVCLNNDPATWLLVDANLSGAGELTYTSLQPWAFVNKKMLILFGPSGSQGVVCLNGAPLHVKVPRGRTSKPYVEEHEGLIVVVLNSAQVDTAYTIPDGIVIGAAGLDENDQPWPCTKWKGMPIKVDHHGQTSSMRVNPPASLAKATRHPPAPQWDAWEQATLDDLINGTSHTFKPIDGPASLEALKCDHGYGWYRFSAQSSRSESVFAPQCSDRIHLFQSGKRLAILGRGPSASDQPTKLKIDGIVTAMADNLGRFYEGWSLGEPKGLSNHIYAVKPIRMAKPKEVTVRDIDPFQLNGYMVGLRQGDQIWRDPTKAMVWQFKSAARKPMILDIQKLPVRAMFLVNAEPLVMYDPKFSSGRATHLLVVGQTITSGKNELRVVPFDLERSFDLRKYINLYQCTETLTDQNNWAFTSWSLPPRKQFGPIKEDSPGLPCWYCGTFTVKHTDMPLWLEPSGLTKGQIILNGQNAGRYFVATATGKAVPPQKRYYLPEPWLNIDQPNEIWLFEEHGKPPDQCRLVYATAADAGTDGRGGQPTS